MLVFASTIHTVVVPLMQNINGAKNKKKNNERWFNGSHNNTTNVYVCWWVSCNSHHHCHPHHITAKKKTNFYWKSKAERFMIMCDERKKIFCWKDKVFDVIIVEHWRKWKAPERIPNHFTYVKRRVKQKIEQKM